MQRHAATRHACPTDAEAARLLRAVGSDVEARDAAWAGLRAPRRPRPRRALDRPAAAGARRARAPARPPLLGLLAWLAGNGALAWCAVDRAVALEPGHSLARLVGDLLTAAVPPTDWEQVWAMPDPA